MEKQTQREQTYGHRERVRCMERVTWKLALPYVKQIASGDLLYDTRNTKPVLWENLERWNGKGGGRGVQEGGDICIPMAASC